MSIFAVQENQTYLLIFFEKIYQFIKTKNTRERCDLSHEFIRYTNVNGIYRSQLFFNLALSCQYSSRRERNSFVSYDSNF